jgi:endonuclease/exonuclease/phosphatase family metal-dependent hydrolase/sugar phosphate isomerase/epimerase
MKKFIFLFFLNTCLLNIDIYGIKPPKQWKVGTTTSVFGGFWGLTYNNMKLAKQQGIDVIEISLTNVVNGKHSLNNIQLKDTLRRIKSDADKAGIEIWSIHMPYGADCDPSALKESERKLSEKKYATYIDAVSVAHPKYILFHPSWRLGLNERELRMQQCVKTIKSLNKKVRKIGAYIIIENLLGPNVLRSPTVERPLGRTVDEMIKLMSMMPEDVYAIVDMNHIKNPEKLINSLGRRLKSVHISDGTGEKECHMLPGRGYNNWTKIFQALYNVDYTGPFLYEIRGSEVKSFGDLFKNYNKLYNEYLQSKGSINIGSYNIRFITPDDKDSLCWDSRKMFVAKTIIDNDYDVIGLNEVIKDTQGEDMMKMMPNYTFVWGMNNGIITKQVNAIAYRTDKFDLLNQGYYYLSENPSMPMVSWDCSNHIRHTVWAKLRYKTTGEIMYYFITHLDHKGVQARIEGAKINVEMARKIAGQYPIVICGDHNTAPSNHAVYDIYSNNFTDSRIAAEIPFKWQYDGTINKWRPNNLKVPRIDYIWVKKFIVQTYKNINDDYGRGVTPSDHLAIEATVTTTK